MSVYKGDTSYRRGFLCRRVSNGGESHLSYFPRTAKGTSRCFVVWRIPSSFVKNANGRCRKLCGLFPFQHMRTRECLPHFSILHSPLNLFLILIQAEKPFFHTASIHCHFLANASTLRFPLRRCSPPFAFPTYRTAALSRHLDPPKFCFHGSSTSQEIRWSGMASRRLVLIVRCSVLLLVHLFPPTG